jgi:hypothetical protein
MPHENQKPEKAWYRDPVKVLTVLTLLVGLPVAVQQLYVNVIKKDAAAVSVQYVLDVSHAMAGRIGGKEKLAAAKDEIVSAVGGSPDIAYSLRLAGPGCSESYEEPSVNFGLDNADEFESALASVTARGTSDFARSVRYAVNDVVEQQSKEGSKSASLFFLIGGRDPCTIRPATVVCNSLRFLDPKKTIDVNFKFIGVRVRPGARRIVRRATRCAREVGFLATRVFANTPAELGESLQPPQPDEPTP